VCCHQGFLRLVFSFVPYLVGRFAWEMLHHLLCYLRVALEGFFRPYNIQFIFGPHFAVPFVRDSLGLFVAAFARFSFRSSG
jgi:hypothetical protein